jgi:hypothetical protein
MSSSQCQLTSHSHSHTTTTTTTTHKLDSLIEPNKRPESNTTIKNDEHHHLYNDFEYWTKSYSHLNKLDEIELSDANKTSQIDGGGDNNYYYVRKFNNSYEDSRGGLETSAAATTNTTTTTSSSSLQHSPITPHSSDATTVNNVVSRLKNWMIKKQPSLLLLSQSPLSLDNRMDTTNSKFLAASPNTKQQPPSLIANGSATYNPPLSIEFIRKLKRPGHVPYSLEYTSNQVFQGSVLEDWLLQTLEEQIYACKQQQQQPRRLGNELDEGVTTQQAAASSVAATGLATVSSTATTSATSLIMEVNNEDEAGDERQRAKKQLNSESYRAAIQNTSDIFANLSEPLTIDSCLYNVAAAANNKNSSNSNIPALFSPNQTTSLLYKRQEANFYVQQILTNLLALGVLEYESGFESAINRTFKVRTARFISFYFREIFKN